MRDIIKRNLFFKTNFDINKKTGRSKFFLIGIVPVAIVFENDKKEMAIINVPLIIKKDPYIRALHGRRFREIRKTENFIKGRFKKDVDYRKLGDKILDIAEKSMNKIIDEEKFMGKKIKSITIVKVENKEKN